MPPYDAQVPDVPDRAGSPWGPPPAPPPPSSQPSGPSGSFQGADGRWYTSSVPPAPGWWLASDLQWYPPSERPAVADPAEAWRNSRWGLGDFWWGVLTYVVGSIAMSFALVLGIKAIHPDTPLDEIEFGPYSVAIGLLANVVAFGGIPWLASRRKGLRSLAGDFGLRFRPVDLAIGAGFGFGALVVGAFVGAGLDRALDVQDDAGNIPIDDLHGPGQVLVFALAIAIITPIIEELFFRGLLNRSLRKRGAGAAASFVITTLVFMLPHLLAQPGWPEIAVLAGVITVYGASFQAACLVTGNRLGAPIVAHMIVNGIAVLVLAAG